MLMTNKELNKVQNEVRKASEKTLTGAVKAWCQLFKSGKEINDILKFANNEREKTDIIELFLSLKKNAKGTLESSRIKKIKAVDVKIYEIIKGSLRVFYTSYGGDVYIVHICRKQKNKTELKDIKLAEKRAKEIHSI